jgi:hypothetical protein
MQAALRAISDGLDDTRRAQLTAAMNSPSEFLQLLGARGKAGGPPSRRVVPVRAGRGAPGPLRRLLGGDDVVGEEGADVVARPVGDRVPVGGLLGVGPDELGLPPQDGVVPQVAVGDRLPPPTASRTTCHASLNCSPVGGGPSSAGKIHGSSATGTSASLQPPLAVSAARRRYICASSRRTASCGASGSSGAACAARPGPCREEALQLILAQYYLLGEGVRLVGQRVLDALLDQPRKQAVGVDQRPPVLFAKLPQRRGPGPVPLPGHRAGHHGRPRLPLEASAAAATPNGQLRLPGPV